MQNQFTYYYKNQCELFDYNFVWKILLFSYIQNKMVDLEDWLWNSNRVSNIFETHRYLKTPVKKFYTKKSNLKTGIA